MNFCENCGTKANSELAKYCGNCGSPLAVLGQESKITEIANQEEKNPESNAKAVSQSENNSVISDVGYEQKGAVAYGRGKKFEDMVEEILKAEGYSTERNRRLTGEKGVSEIDILATKTRKGVKETLAVECKNYSSNVGVEKVRDFREKLNDLNIKNGRFVAIPNCSSDAAQWAERAGFELWNEDEVKDKYIEMKIGRLATGEVRKLEYFLPLKVQFVVIASGFPLPIC